MSHLSTRKNRLLSSQTILLTVFLLLFLCITLILHQRCLQSRSFSGKVRLSSFYTDKYLCLALFFLLSTYACITATKHACKTWDAALTWNAHNGCASTLDAHHSTYLWFRGCGFREKIPLISVSCLTGNGFCRLKTVCAQWVALLEPMSTKPNQPSQQQMKQNMFK